MKYLFIYILGAVITYAVVLGAWRRKGNGQDTIREAKFVCGFFAVIWPFTLLLLADTIRDRCKNKTQA